MRAKNRDWGQAGFTIAELLVASALTVIFATTFVVLAVGMQRQMVQQNMYYNTNRSARYALDRISRDIKESVGLVYTYGGATRGNTTLILKLPSIDASGVPTNIASEFDYVTYKLDPSDATRLVRTLDVNNSSQREGGDATNTLVAKKIGTLLFSYAGTAFGSVAQATVPTLKYVNVAITASGTTLNRSQSTVVDSDVMLRNYIT
jgi:type II secretory pathway pseudopilin PulG